MRSTSHPEKHSAQEQTPREEPVALQHKRNDSTIMIMIIMIIILKKLIILMIIVVMIIMIIIIIIIIIIMIIIINIIIIMIIIKEHVSPLVSQRGVDAPMGSQSSFDGRPVSARPVSAIRSAQVRAYDSVPRTGGRIWGGCNQSALLD